jgi:protein SCO1
MFKTILLIALFTVVAPCFAAPATNSTVSVVNAWASTGARGASGGAYFQIDNTGRADRLLAIETAAAARVEIHATRILGGVMRMRVQGSVPIPAHATVSFEPDALHAMLVDLKRPLSPGDSIWLTMVFERSGRLQVKAEVKAMDAMQPEQSARDTSAEKYRLAVYPSHAHNPAFELVDTDGRPRSLKDFSGNMTVVFFGFLQCPDSCPAELFKLSMVMNRLGALGARVRVVFVTLDPERDGPALLTRYVKGFDPRFTALTGTTEKISAAARSFSVEFARVPTAAGYTIDHSTATFVFDARGRLRLVASMNTSVDDFVHDLKALAEQP